MKSALLPPSRLLSLGAITPVILSLALLAAAPIAVKAQCNESSRYAVVGVFVAVYFTPGVMNCNVMTANAMTCSAFNASSWPRCDGSFGNGSEACVRITAFDAGGTDVASCMFTCTTGCTQITIDGPNDGLPVELMEFSVETDESPDPDGPSSDRDLDG